MPTILILTDSPTPCLADQVLSRAGRHLLARRWRRA
jgi:hypothetical protein